MHAFSSFFTILIGLWTTNAANTDVDILNFALNLEYLEATFYSFVAYGHGLNSTELGGGPSPNGTSAGFRARLSPSALLLAERIAKDELAHVLFLRKALGKLAVPAPAVDVGLTFGKLIRAALKIDHRLSPPFSPYKSDIAFFIGAFIFEDVGVTAYKSAAQYITDKDYLEAAAGILATEAYHAGLVRSVLIQRKDEYFFPYGLTVSSLVTAISDVRKAASGQDDDQGIFLNSSIVLAPADANALAFGRSSAQVLSVVYLGGSGKGGFFPDGLNGVVK